ncbi:hypothetical protein SALBM217S_02894 [Streptomyces griseoloalbus]
MVSASEKPSDQERAASASRDSMRSLSLSDRGRSSVPCGTRTTKCSRERTDSVFQAVKSTLTPPSSSLRMSMIRSRTAVV